VKIVRSPPEASRLAPLAGCHAPLPHATLVVAIGGTVLGVTIWAVGLLVTRDAGDPTGRRRAGLGAGLSIALLLALVAGCQAEPGGPVVIPDEEPAAGRAP